MRDRRSSRSRAGSGPAELRGRDVRPAAGAPPRPAPTDDRPGSRSRPRSAAPSTGGASSRRMVAAGCDRLDPGARSAPRTTASLARNTPPARTTTGSRRARWSRRMMAPAMVASSSASRSRIALGHRVPVAARRRRPSGRGRTGRSPGGARTRWPRSRRSAGACRRTPAPSAPARSSGRGRRGRGPRRPAPPCPARRRRPSRPRSGRARRAWRSARPAPIPAALTPAPQMRPTPQPRSEPARIGAIESLTISVVEASRRASKAAPQAADVGRACRPRPGRTTRRPPADAPAGRSEPGPCPGRRPPARRVARPRRPSRPSGASSSDRARTPAAGRRAPTSSRSVFEFPPSTARTATSGGRAGLT